MSFGQEAVLGKGDIKAHVEGGLYGTRGVKKR